MKGIILAIVVLSLFLIPNFSQARNVSIDLRMLKRFVNIGDECSVKVNIDHVGGLEGINISISFDNQRLEYKSIEEEILIGNFMESKVSDPKISNSDGKIEYSAILKTSVTGIDFPGGTILTLNFVANSFGHAWIRLNGWDCSLEYQGGRPIINSKKKIITVRATQIAGNLKVNELKNQESQNSGNYLLNAGRALEASAGLKCGGSGALGIGFALSQSSDEGLMEFGRILLCGSTLSLISPYYIRKAGIQLSRANFGDQIRESGIALQKCGSSYYDGLVISILGTGLSAGGIIKKSESAQIAGVAFILGGLIYSSIVPPHYLSTAGSSLGKAEFPFMEANLLLHEAGMHLVDAGGLQYGGIISLLGGITAIAYGLSNNDESSLMAGIGVSGLSILLNIVADIRIGIAGMRLVKAATMMESSN